MTKGSYSYLDQGSVPVAPTLPLKQVCGVCGHVLGAPTELPMERCWEKNQNCAVP